MLLAGEAANDAAFEYLSVLLLCFSVGRVDHAGVICKQEGIFRVNCMDCLDRTNVVQAAIARVVMEQQACITDALFQELSTSELNRHREICVFQECCSTAKGLCKLLGELWS